MRFGAILMAVALASVACGTTAEDAATDQSSLASSASTTSSSPDPALDPSTSTTGSSGDDGRVDPPDDGPPTLHPERPFEAHTMGQMFPPGQPTIVVWIRPFDVEVIGQLAFRLVAPDGEAANDRWDLPPPGEELVLLTTMSVPANRYDLIVTVPRFSTDTSVVDREAEAQACQMSVELASGHTFGLWLAPPLALEEEVRTVPCAGSTFSQWRDQEGRPVSPDDVIDLPGPSHCEWEDVVFLTAGNPLDRVFARDVEGTFGPDWYPASDGGDPLTFAELDALPPDAVFSGNRSNGRELWFSASDDYDSLRTAESVERWPKISPRPLCA